MLRKCHSTPVDPRMLMPDAFFCMHASGIVLVQGYDDSCAMTPQRDVGAVANYSRHSIKPPSDCTIDFYPCSFWFRAHVMRAVAATHAARGVRAQEAIGSCDAVATVAFLTPWPLDGHRQLRESVVQVAP